MGLCREGDGLAVLGGMEGKLGLHHACKCDDSFLLLCDIEVMGTGLC